MTSGDPDELHAAPENEAQVELWNAPVNLRWVSEQERLDRAFGQLDVSLRLSSKGLQDAVDFALLAGPLARALFDRRNDAELVAQVRAAVREALARYESAGTVALGAAFWVATARA